MKMFRGPRFQGGWIGIAAAAAASAYDGYEKNKQNEQAKQDTQDLSEGGFERQAWLAQQQRKFALQDRQYKEDAIAGYRPFYTGPAVATPPPTSTQGLADWDPNATDGNGKPKPIPLLSAPAGANPYGYPYGQ